MAGMITSIAAALSAIENAKKLAKDINDLSRTAERQEMLVDFNAQILDAQRALFQVRAEYEELAKIKGELERKLLEKEDWNRQAARYELKELASGVLVYAVKPGMEAGEPFHYACPHCMQKQQRSILSLPGPGWGKYVCHQCSYEAVFQAPTIMPVAVRRRSRELDGI